MVELENFIKKTTSEIREILISLIEEYYNLHELAYGEYISVNYKINNMTIIKISLTDDDVLHCSHKGGGVVPWDFDMFMNLAKQIDELNKPYRALIPYKKKESISFEIVEYNNYIPTKEKTIIGESLDDVFKILYTNNNRLRYCNGYFYKIKDKDIEKQYKEWLTILPHWYSFDLYYNGGIVD
jgi:hypothetical protein